jgi:protein SCO1/2
MKTLIPATLTLALTLGTSFLVGAAQAATSQSATSPMKGVHSTATTQPVALPSDSVYQLPLTLTNQRGETFDWTTRRGKPQIVGMFYTSCRYICPLIIESGQRGKLGVLFISMDAARDDPAKLMGVVRERKVDPRWVLAVPKAEDVRSVAGVLDIQYRQLSDGEFNHTSALILLDANGRIVARTEKMGSELDPEFLAAVKAQL